MEVLNIKSKLFSGIVSLFIKKAISNNFGVDVEVKISELVVSEEKDDVTIHIVADGKIPKTKTAQLVKKLIK